MLQKPQNPREFCPQNFRLAIWYSYLHLWLHSCYCTLCMYSMEDGLLLKPTRPAMSLDSTFTQRAFGQGGPKGQLWTGYTAYKQSSVSVLVVHLCLL